MAKRDLTGYLLNYLLDNYFDSKADMARKLDMNKRILQRIINDPDPAKGGSIALEKALGYCAQHHVPLDPVLNEYCRYNFENEEERTIATVEPAATAYSRLVLPAPDGLTEEGLAVMESMCSFIQQASAHICPNCANWCNPWDGTDKLTKGDCYLAQMARNILRDVSALYTKEET